MPVNFFDTYILSGLQPAYDAEDAITNARRIQPSLTAFPAGGVWAESTVNANAVHTLAANGASAGNFKLQFRGYTTTELAFDSTAAAVAAALNALASVGAGGVVGTGTAVNSTGSILTWSGAAFANQPVELPTIVITVTFVAATLTIVSTTTGSVAGTLVPYIDGQANGQGVAKALNQYLLSTDAAGMITFGAAATGEQFGQTRLTAPVWIRGYFRTDDILQTGNGSIDAAGIADLGKLVSGSSSNGVLRVS